VVAYEAALAAAAVAKGEAHRPPAHRAHSGVYHVFHYDVANVLASHRSRLQQRKAGLHEEDQEGANEHPQDGQLLVQVAPQGVLVVGDVHLKGGVGGGTLQQRAGAGRRRQLAARKARPPCRGASARHVLHMMPRQWYTRFAGRLGWGAAQRARAGG
jgi:hypothetical protein